MRNRFIYEIIVTTVILSISFFQDNALSSDYISVREYNAIHPEQVAISAEFSKRVKTRSIPIAKGIQTKQVAIAFIYPGEQASDYWRRSITSFKARMDELQIDYSLTAYSLKPVQDYRIQEKQIKAALDTKPDYLVFTFDIKKHKRILERIIVKPVPKIILQNITTPIRVWEGKQPFLYVGFDHARGAEVIAKYFIRQTRGKGNYAMLYFSRGYVSTMRGDTFIQYLKKKSDLKLVSSYYTDGNRNKSKQATLEIIKEHPDVKFIYACATDVSLGAIEALSSRKDSDPIMINGWGGGSRELEMIENQNMDVTIMRLNDDNGVAMAEAIRLDIEGANKKVPTVYSGDFALIEKGISQNKLKKLKHQAFRYSGID